MKLINKLTPVALATAMALGSLAAPLAAQADVSSSATISSMYLWRGQDISSSAPVLSGDITYNHSSGAYASLWISSLGLGAGPGYSTESDYTIGLIALNCSPATRFRSSIWSSSRVTGRTLRR